MDTERPGLRERTRRAVRVEIRTVAMELFLSQGYDQTSIDQIAEAAGLSRRSFFRYFAAKDEILEETLVATGRSIAAALSERPTHEPTWTALRRALDLLLDRIDSDPRARATTRMMLESPALASSQRATQLSWQNDLVEVLEPRLSQNLPDRRLRAAAMAGAALSCLTNAQTEWARTNHPTPIGTLLDTTMSAVHPLGT